MPDLIVKLLAHVCTLADTTPMFKMALVVIFIIVAILIFDTVTVLLMLVAGVGVTGILLILFAWWSISWFDDDDPNW